MRRSVWRRIVGSSGNARGFHRLSEAGKNIISFLNAYQY
jgi:hypothetical protein